MTGKPKTAESLVCMNDISGAPEPISGMWLTYLIVLSPYHPKFLCVLTIIVKSGSCIAIKDG